MNNKFYFLFISTLPLLAFQNCDSFHSLQNSNSFAINDLLVLSSFEMETASAEERCRDIQYSYQNSDQRDPTAVDFATTEQERMRKLLSASLDRSQILKEGDLEPSGATPNLNFQQDNSCPAEASGSSSCRTYHVGPSAGFAGHYRLDDGIRIRHILNEIQNFKKTNSNHWVQIKFSKSENYYLRSNPFSAWALGVQGISNFVFDGNDSNFWISSHSQFLQVKNCTNCTIKNAHAEHFDRSHIQGTIVGLSQSGENYFLSVKVDEGYPLPPENPLYSLCGDGVSAGSKGRLLRKFAHMSFFQGSRMDIQPGNASYVFLNGVQTVHRSQRLAAVRIPASLNAHVSANALKSRMNEVVQIKRRFAFSLPQSSHDYREAMKFQAKNSLGLRSFIAESEAGFANYSMLLIAGSSNVKVKNLGIHSTVKMAVRPLHNKGLIHFDGLQLVPRGNSLLAGASDGIHGPSNRGSTIIENSVFKNLMDDGIHLKTSGIRIVTKHSNSEFTFSQPAPQSAEWDVRVGDTLQMIDSATGADLGEYKVNRAESILHDAYLRYRITLNKNLSLPKNCSENQLHHCVYFFNTNTSHPNSMIRNNLFENKLRHAIITHGGSTISGNWMEHLQGGVLLTASHIGPEGPVGSSFGINGNVMLDVTGLPLNSFIQSSQGAQNPKIQTGLEAHCNIFETLGSSVISLKDITGRTSRNLFYKSNQPAQASFPASVSSTSPLNSDPAGDSWCASQFPSITQLSKYKNRNSFKALSLAVVPATPAPPPQQTSPVITGLFRTPDGGIYHGFKDFYCRYANMDKLIQVWGSQWAKIASSVETTPTEMEYSGVCGNWQGIHKQGTGFYYTYKEGYTCWINSVSKLKAWGGIDSSHVPYLPNKNMAALGLNARATTAFVCQ